MRIYQGRLASQHQGRLVRHVVMRIYQGRLVMRIFSRIQIFLSRLPTVLMQSMHCAQVSLSLPPLLCPFYLASLTDRAFVCILASVCLIHTRTCTRRERD